MNGFVVQLLVVPVFMVVSFINAGAGTVNESGWWLFQNGTVESEALESNVLEEWRVGRRT